MDTHSTGLQATVSAFGANNAVLELESYVTTWTSDQIYTYLKCVAAHNIIINNNNNNNNNHHHQLEINDNDDDVICGAKCD